MKTETPRQVAEKIVRAYYPDDDELLESIRAALKDRDERAAKIAETHNDEHGGDCEYKNCGLAIAERIRS